MNTKNLLLGGIAGGVVYFLLGWLFYGTLFAGYFHDHQGAATGVERKMEEMVWWALIAGNLIAGFLLSYIFSKAGVSTLSSGLITGAVIGLLMSCAMDLIMYATTNTISKSAMLADVGISTVMSAIAGAVVGAVMGMGNKTAAAV